MRHIYQSTFKDQNGAVVGSSTTSDSNPGTVTVYLAGTDTLASVYVAAVGGTAVNSVSTDAYGYFFFWVDDATYPYGQMFKIVLTHPDFISRTYDNIYVINVSASNIDEIFGAVGDGITDDTVAIQAALDASAGNYLYLPTGSYKISANLNVNVNGITFYGPGTLVATSTITGGMVLCLNGDNINIRDISIDGGLVPTGTWVRGIGASGSCNNVLIENVRVFDTSFSGIDFTDNEDVYDHTRVKIINCNISNSGWVGINVCGVNDLEVSGNTISRTGYDAVAVWRSANARIRNNKISKATAPDIIYDGAGSYLGVEKGGFIYIEPHDSECIISGNNCEDNINAGWDGIIIGEAVSHEFSNISISHNVLKNCGGYGIDTTSNCSTVGNVVTGAVGAGIFCGNDLGGTIRNVVIANNVLHNIGIDADAYGILISSNNAQANVFSNISIHGNVVSDDRATKFTEYGIGINRSDGTFSRISIGENDFSLVDGESVNMFGTGNTNGVYFWTTNNIKTTPKTISGTTPSVIGHNFFLISNGDSVTMTDMVEGYVGQDILVMFANANTTLTLTGGNMYGNGGSNKTPTQYETARAFYTGSTWYWQFHT
jgi:parallel beta-helix repeat protein